AKRMIEEVSRVGGNAIKFQAYKAETLASRFSPAYWDTRKEPTRSQFELFKKHDKFWKKEFEELADYCKTYKIDFLATPFDMESVDFLDPLMNSFKIASADITNKPLLEKIASKEKPVLLSTGASTMGEIRRAIELLKRHGAGDITLLHCVLNYPTRWEDANLWRIVRLSENFPGHRIGYSDHTSSDSMMEVLPLAWMLGAEVIEKHYTWNKNLPGNDHYHAMDFKDLKQLVEKFKRLEKMMGSGVDYLESESVARKYARRSLVATRNIRKGEIIRRTDITSKRPGTGVSPWKIESIVGRTAKKNIQEDEILTEDSVEC
ncbi:MAG: acetylneuraminic acid synthetase, partial [Thermoproteota archaeon]